MARGHQRDVQGNRRRHAGEDARRYEVEFLGGLSETQKAAFEGAADRWVQIILGDLPEMRMPGLAAIDDLRVMAGACASTVPKGYSAPPGRW